MIKNYEKLANDISNWLKEYLESNKLNCFIVGVSGGIDSAVVSALCSRSGIKTRAFSLSINSNPENTKNSLLQCGWLVQNYENAVYSSWDLSSTYKEFSKADNIFLASDLAKANTKSRLRMVFLYYIANSHKGLVVGTGNFCEDEIAKFCTKYGDSGVDISPIGSLMKSEVYELAKYLGIPQEIIDAPPTDGLWEDNRKDHEQLTCSYDDLEWAYNFTKNLEQGKRHFLYPNEENSVRKNEILTKFYDLYENGKHKMEMPPIFKVNHEEYS